MTINNGKKTYYAFRRVNIFEVLTKWAIVLGIVVTFCTSWIVVVLPNMDNMDNTGILMRIALLAILMAFVCVCTCAILNCLIKASAPIIYYELKHWLKPSKVKYKLVEVSVGDEAMLVINRNTGEGTLYTDILTDIEKEQIIRELPKGKYFVVSNMLVLSDVDYYHNAVYCSRFCDLPDEWKEFVSLHMKKPNFIISSICLASAGGLEYYRYGTIK